MALPRTSLFLVSVFSALCVVPACSSDDASSDGATDGPDAAANDAGAVGRDDASVSGDGSTPPDGSVGPCPVTLVVGQDTTAPAVGSTRPALGVPYVDPAYHLTVARVTDPSQITDHDIPNRVRHEYSRRPPFNADSSRVLMDSSNGWFRLYDVKADGTLSFVKTIDVSDNQEPNWDPVSATKLYYLESYGQGLTISTYDVSNDQTAVYRDLGARVKGFFPDATGMWTKGEGRPSDDGKVWCLEAGHTEQPGSNFVADGFIAYDITTDTILGHMATDETPDHVSTSPKGDYCVPSWGLGKGTRAYKTDFSTFTQLEDRSEHSDMAITKGGEEVYVYSAYDGADAGNVMMVKLSDGSRVPLFALYGDNHASVSMHVSGTSKNKPGYVVISLESCNENYGADACNPSTQWFYEKVVAVELAANPKIYNLAHDHFGDAGYFGETQSVSNPDLTKVLFASSWESTAETDVHDYMIQVPSCALP